MQCGPDIMGGDRIACPHFDLEIVARARKHRSAVASAAYQSGEKLYCDFENKTKNYPKSREFSEMLQQVMNSYVNGMLSNQQVIDEMLEIARLMKKAHEEGNNLGLTEEEMAFYDALTRPEAITDFYKNEDLVNLTRELTDALRKNRTIDWEKRDDARAKMRMMIKKLLKRYKYPPEGMEDALKTVLEQCELWTDNAENSYYGNHPVQEALMTAGSVTAYQI